MPVIMKRAKKKKGLTTMVMSGLKRARKQPRRMGMMKKKSES